MPTRKVLMFSGGLDSACAYHILGKPDCLCCGGELGPNRDAGLGEYKALSQMLELDDDLESKLTVANFDWTPFMRGGKRQLPRENLLSIVAWAQGYDVAMFGWVKNDNTNYKRIQHMKKVTVGAVDMPGFTTSFPVWKYYKHQLVDRAVHCGATTAFLNASWSCLVRHDVHCGECINCCERYLAMQCNDVDETEYLTDPNDTVKMAELIKKYEGNAVWRQQLSA